MQPHLVEIPMARAHLHFAHARFPQAVGAFRAAVGVDPTAVRAHLGLADALAALGRREEAVDRLVEAAETFGARDEHEGAMSLLGRALSIDPSRMELDVDLAMVEEAMGQHDAAVARVEGLADRYMDVGRTDEAAELLRFLMSWGDADEAVSEEPLPEVVPAGPVHTALITGDTVIARNPLLHTLEMMPVATMPEPEVATVAEPEPDMVTRVARVQPHNPVVDRLRARAGLGHAAGRPRRTASRPTEPIAIRRGLTMRPTHVQEEDVTMRFRRPRQLDVAI